jgi:hypothetical protein
MKTLILSLTFVSLIFLAYSGKIISLETNKYNLTDVPTIDKYKEYIVQSSKIKQAGQKINGKTLNDRITLDICIPDYTSDKGKVVCRFYKEYYKTLANKLDGLLEVEVNLYNSKNLAGTKEGNVYYKGGIVCNYAKEEFAENVLK